VKGGPCSPLNRRIVHVPFYTPCVVTGSYKAVKHCGKGRVENEDYLGKIVVPGEDMLWIVQRWLNQALEGTTGGLTDDVLSKFKEIVSENSVYPEGANTEPLDVWKANIINRHSGDHVFALGQPNSFP
jgi:hypothetical protein